MRNLRKYSVVFFKALSKTKNYLSDPYISRKSDYYNRGMENDTQFSCIGLEDYFELSLTHNVKNGSECC